MIPLQIEKLIQPECYCCDYIELIFNNASHNSLPGFDFQTESSYENPAVVIF